MAVFPRQHHLTKESGFFNDDGYWDPADYIGVDLASSSTDPFAQLVLTMKQAAIASNQTIRDDADVNRAKLRASSSQLSSGSTSLVHWRCLCPEVRGCWYLLV